MLHLYHFNDVIAQNDTTVERLRVQYQLLCDYFSIKEYTLHTIASEFSNSQQTGQQCLQHIQKLQEGKEENSKSTIICVNNASRSKHKDSGNAKGSECLWAIIRTKKNQNPIHVVGVDNDVFSIFGDQIEQLGVIHDISINGITKKDISQGSQFRSLEYWPTVQVFLQSISKENLPNKITDTIIHHPTKNASIRVSPSNISILNTAQTKNNTEQYTTPSLQHIYQKNYTCIKNIQLVGQAKKFRSDWNIQAQQGFLKKLEYNNDAYKQLQQSLEKNEVIIIDRDKFNNTKVLTAHHDGIIGLVNYLKKNIGDKVELERNNHTQKKVETDTAYIVTSISDKTGEKCIRNGSSRGPDQETLVELNYSIDNSHTTRKKIQTLPLGTRIHIH